MKFFAYLLFPLFAVLSSPTRMSVTSKQTFSCAPARYAFRATIASVQSGKWSDPATWGGRVPAVSDAPMISQGNTVFADTDAAIVGMQITGILMFDPSKSVTLQSTKNILVTGLLEMLSPKPANVHTIRFTGINENNFAGGGMDPVTSDVGLWVMGAGRLHLQGADKTSWTNTASTIAANSTAIPVYDAAGWLPGDELIISPTSAGSQKVDNVTIDKMDGRIIYATQLISSTHPKINNQWTAEVGNLTRNVRIEGTATGRSHVFIRSTSPQFIQNVAFRYLGPRKDQNGDNIKDLILGRYGIHFHHCDDGSDGSIVEGCVMRDIGNHAYVPHVSNGIEFRDNIAYNCTEAPFWWDLPDATHRATWVHNLVVQPTYVFHSLGFDTQGALTLGTHAFVLGMGDDNRCDSNVVAGQQGLETVNASYDWEEMPIESAWTFRGNTVHNSDCGIRSWQNNGKNHVLEQTTIYNCGTGVFHGAYVNNYTYQGGTMYNAVFEDHAASGENGVRLENMTLDGAGLVDYPFHIVPKGAAPGERPILIRATTIKGGKKGAIFDEAQENNKNIDVIQSDITGTIKIATTVKAGETIRVQPASGQAYKLTKSGKSNIANFAPISWGTGTGLLGQYFNNTDFTDLVETRIDPLINFPEWQLPLPGCETGVHHLVKDETYSCRFAGYIEPQYNEVYKFSILTGGGVRLWIDGKLLIDKWSDVYPTTYTSNGITLQAGRRYAIRLEYLNNDDRSALYLYWSSTTMKKQLIPQTQLYSF